MQRPLQIVLGVLVVLTLAYYTYAFFTGDRANSPEALARTALEGSSPEEKTQAALDLAALGKEAAGPMRDVLSASNEPTVRAAMIEGLAALRDWQSMPQFIEALGDDSTVVRGRAGRAVSRLLGVDFHYSATAPAPERARKIKEIQEAYETMNKNLPPQYRGEG